MTTGSTVFEVRPARAWRRLHHVLVVAAAVSWVAWLATRAGRGEALSAGFAPPLLLIIAAAAVWRSEPVGRLLRDSGGWCFEGAGSAPNRTSGELVVALDLGAWMLLRFRPDGARWPRNRRWFALSRSGMPADWQAFRRAVYSPRPSAAGLSAQAPADPPA